MTNLENQYLKKDREAFEAFHKKHFSSHYEEFETDDEGRYLTLDMFERFEVWQASKSHYLSERNECVEEIRRLREAVYLTHEHLKLYPYYKKNHNIFDYCESVKSTSPTIERLLKESK